MKKKKKEKLIREGLPLRVWEEATENTPKETEVQKEEEENVGSNYNPFSDDDIEGE